jgi:hypothetical protein
VPRSGSARISAHDPDRQQRVGRLVDSIHPPLEQRRDEEDDDDLRELGRLNAERPDVQPSRRAVDRMPEQHRHERQADQRQARPDHDGLAVIAVIDAHDHRHEDESEQRPGPLLEQIQVGVVVGLHRHHRGGAVDHDDARTHEQQRGREQQLVGFELSRHTSPPGRLDKPAFLRRCGWPEGQRCVHR